MCKQWAPRQDDGAFSARAQAPGTKIHSERLGHQEKMRGRFHLIAKHKALLPTFEDENDDHSESSIDVGVEADEEE